MFLNYLFLILFVNANANDELRNAVENASQVDNLVKNIGITNTGCNNSTPSLSRGTIDLALALECLDSLCPKDNSGNGKGALTPYQLGQIAKNKKISGEKKFNEIKVPLSTKIDKYIGSTKQVIDKIKSIQKGDVKDIDSSNLIHLFYENISLNSIDGKFKAEPSNLTSLGEKDLLVLNNFISETNKYLTKNKDMSPGVNIDSEDSFVKIKSVALEKVKKLKLEKKEGLAKAIEDELNTGESDAYAVLRTIILVDSLNESTSLQKEIQPYLESKLKSLNLDNIKKLLNNDMKTLALGMIKGNIIYDEAHKCDPKIFENMINEVKLNYKKNVINKFSQETQTKLKDYIDNDVKVSLDDQSSLAKLEREKYKLIISSIEKTSNENEKAIQQNSQAEVISLAFKNFSNPDNANTILDCMMPNLTDHFNNESNMFGQIKISSFSCANPEVGKGILAHEMGHAISILFAKSISKNPEDNNLVKNFKLNLSDYNKFLSTRKCIDNYHVQKVISDNQYGGKFHENDGFRVEEDMADWFLTKAELSNNTLMTCTLLQDNINNQLDFTDLEYKSDKMFNTDPHSVGFFRVLNEAFQKDKLGLKCDKFLKKNEHLIRLKKCDQ